MNYFFIYKDVSCTLRCRWIVKFSCSTSLKCKMQSLSPPTLAVLRSSARITVLVFFALYSLNTNNKIYINLRKAYEGTPYWSKLRIKSIAQHIWKMFENKREKLWISQCLFLFGFNGRCPHILKKLYFCSTEML